ncbi:TrkH family potassium uptake protein [Geotoga petraea]|uniref:TrkH family potassium uptake protein n=1 Tax=Geotoga petraea TaxID=28234 RepID=A0A4Z0W3E8_9BACT|nr:TrkH family potassium uptake protein [Geotoga petraea]TGG88359.1 TrkH family potassium uptake protein [Geotoga petraea]
MSNYLIFLKSRYKSIFKATGDVLLALSILILSISVISLIFLESQMFFPFFYTSLIGFGISFSMKFGTRKNNYDFLNIQDAVMIIFLVWTISIFLSALPFLFSGLLNFTQSIFESTSGWTTTGLTMFLDVESLPKTVLLWRSIMQYIGGAGFALIMVVTAGSMGAGLYQAEGRTDNLVPNLKDSTKLIATIYLTWALIGIISIYIFTDLNFFDSLNHTLTALATGGFSTNNASIGGFDDVKLEVIIMVLMIMGGTGFGVHYAGIIMLRNTWRTLKDHRNKSINNLEFRDRLKREPFFKNPEPKTMFYILLFSFILVVIFSTSNIFDFWNSIRHSAFQVISSLTGTGFSSTILNNWNTFGIFFLTILMVLGGMMDSTSGGIKLYRVYIAFKMILFEIMSYFKPQGIKFHFEVYKGVSKKEINLDTLKNVLSIITMYFLVYFVGVFVLVSHGYNLQDSLFEYASALSAVGLSVGITLPDSPPGVLWTEIFGMYLGRLEFFVILYAIMKLFKDIKDIIKWEH